MEKVKVSVIIPVYNVEKYIGMCIESVCKQTIKEIEIIVVDDGSTDNGYAVCDELAKRDDRIVLIKQENQGVSVARNKGIERATGEWLAFIDSDDWIEPNYLEVLYSAGEKNKADISICGFFFNYPDEEVKRSHYKTDMMFVGRENIKEIQLQILAQNVSRIKDNSGDRIGAPWCKLYRTDFVKSNGLSFIPGLKRSQDVLFNLYALNEAERICYTDTPSYHYRIIDESVCNKFSRQILTNVDDYLREMRLFIKNKARSNQRFVEAYYAKVCTSIYKCLVQYFLHKDNKQSYIEKRRDIILFLRQPMYSKALKRVKYKNLELTEKIFVFCLKYNMVGSIILLVNARRLFIKVLRK